MLISYYYSSRSNPVLWKTYDTHSLSESSSFEAAEADEEPSGTLNAPSPAVVEPNEAFPSLLEASVSFDELMEDKSETEEPLVLVSDSDFCSEEDSVFESNLNFGNWKPESLVLEPKEKPANAFLFARSESPWKSMIWFVT